MPAINKTITDGYRLVRQTNCWPLAASELLGPNMAKLKTRVLIIDDDVNIRNTLALILRHNNYETVLAATGRQALEQAKTGTFELAFLDIRLPDTNGIDLIAPLKEIQPDIAVIIVTAYASLETATKALNAGATAYLNKPVDMDQVLLTIQQVLEKRHLVVENRRLIQEMRQELARRQAAEERLERVNQVLLAIRGVNQLIVRERNQTRLLQQICQLLSDLPEYGSVWIGLMDAAQQPDVIVHCGAEKIAVQVTDSPETDNLLTCWHTALSQPGKVIIENTARVCAACSLAEQGNACMAARLTHGNRVFGVLVAAVKADVFQDERQHALFQDVANDVGLALYTLEQEEAQHRTRQALRESETRFRSVIESATDAIISVDADGRITSWNQGAADMFGYKTEEILGESLTRLMPANIKERFLAAFRRTADTGRLDMAHKTYVGTGIHKDGREIPIEASIATWQTGGQRYFTGIIRDMTERLRAEAQLHLQAEALAAAANVIVITDRNGVITWVNPAFSEITGYTFGEAVGRQPNILKSDRHEAAFYENLWQTILAGQVWRGEIVNRRKDGSLYIEDMTITPVTNTAGEIDYFIAIKLDITRRRQAEVSLQRRNQELNRLYRASGAFLSEVAPDVEALAQVIVTTVQQEFQKSNCSLVLVESGQDALRRIAVAGPFAEQVSQVGLSLSRPGIVASAITSGQVYNVADVQKHTGYLAGWPEARSELVIPLKVGDQVIGAIDMQSDRHNAFDEDDERLLISFAERATLALMNARLFNEVQQRAAQLAALHDIELTISSSLEPDQVYSAIVQQSAELLDCQVAHLVAWDQKVQRGTGLASYSPQPNLIVDRQFRLEDSGLAPELLESGKPIVVNDAAKNKLIKPFWRQIFQIQAMLALPLVYRDSVLGFLFLIETERPRVWPTDQIDLAESLAAQTAVALQNTRLYQQTKRHAAELEQRVAQRTEELQRVNAQLLRAMQAKDAFLASMSHELRTPLNAIMLRGEIMQMEGQGDLSQKQKRSLAIIQESANHLLTLINDILDVAKIEAGKLSLTTDPMSVQSLCQSSLRLIKEMASQKQIQVSSDIDEDAVVLWGDGRRLKQVLVNLLSNAVKFTPEGGQVGLEVRGDADQDRIRFVVWDTGIGIAEEDMPALFKSFSQIDNSLARKYEGTGLGLALAYRLVALHNGSISVESKVGQGSRFTVSLPWPPEQRRWKPLEAEGDKQTEDVAEGTAVSPAAAPKILLADDNKIAVDTLSDYLQFKGYDVIIAYDGLEAVNQAREKKPDLIIMDIQMPGVDGLEAIRRIRADANLADIPIIALTALAMPGDKERCLAAGAIAYYSKPYSLRQLVAAIKTKLNGEERNDS